MKDIFTTLIIMLLCITALARQQAFADSITEPKPAAKQKPGTKPSKPGKPQKKPVIKCTDASPFISPLSLQVLVGSQGIGADVKYGFLPRLSGRLGFGIIPININNAFSFSDFTTADQLSARFFNLHLLADYSPFNKSPFRIVGGAGYIIKGNANAIISPTGTYQFGNTTITHDQIGSLYATVTWKGLAPYLGVAFFKSFPRRLFNMNLDVGTYYLPGPGTSLTGTKLLSDNNTQQPKFNQNMQSYRWLPVVQLNFNFRIK
jgi:hypothetical protein